jgi:hypothetical protein
VIIARYGNRDLIFADGVIMSSDPSIPVPDELGRPQTSVNAIDRIEGGQPISERIETIVEPGSGEHARAAFLKIGAVIEFDGGDA